jgi:hypothetical protein
MKVDTKACDELLILAATARMGTNFLATAQDSTLDKCH